MKAGLRIIKVALWYKIRPEEETRILKRSDLTKPEEIIGFEAAKEHHHKTEQTK